MFGIDKMRFIRGLLFYRCIFAIFGLIGSDAGSAGFQPEKTREETRKNRKSIDRSIWIFKPPFYSLKLKSTLDKVSFGTMAKADLPKVNWMKIRPGEIAKIILEVRERDYTQRLMAR